VTLYRHRALDFAVKALALAAVFESVLPVPVAATVLVALAALLLLRLALWRPDLGCAASTSP